MSCAFNRPTETERPKNLRGTVLIRRPGKTAKADPGEIRAMEDRFIVPTLGTRRRQRLEKVSDALDTVFSVVQHAQPSDTPPVRWTVPRNRLEEALAAWDGPEMPSVPNFVSACTAYQALMYYGAARGDIKTQFWHLDRVSAQRFPLARGVTLT